jgi:hypothetical protein
MGQHVRRTWKPERAAHPFKIDAVFIQNSLPEYLADLV